MDDIKPSAEHAWLDRFVGEWTSEASMAGEVYKGTETVSRIGPFWVQCVGTCPMPGGEDGTMILTLGYDQESRKFTGTWIGSMMPKLWVYDITREADGSTLTMAAEGPAMDGNGKAKYRDVIKWVDNDTREFSGWTQKADGSWSQMMSSTLKRKK